MWNVYQEMINNGMDSIFLLFTFFRDSEVSDCGKYLIVSIYEELRQNLLYIADLEANGEIVGKIPLVPIISEFNADYEVSEVQ